MQDKWIVVSEYCNKCNIAPSFIEQLYDHGLIDLIEDEKQTYLPFVQLPEVERYTRLYYDLSINMEGIDVVHHLLERIHEMQQEINRLHARLNLYESRCR